MTRQLAIDRVQPTQLWLSRRKLSGVLEWFDVADPSYEPLTVCRIDERWCLIDGHTRAFVAHLAGETTLRVSHDESIVESEAMVVYRRCIDWCRAAGIETIGDLGGRLLEHDTYEREWIDRCEAIASQNQ